tara:strand:- start:222 stop:1052 length:831 start_codon:yes stop_codon:yes gene_type:complete
MYSFDSAKADVFLNLITDNGYYVDVGVRDGIHDNKTFLLYKNGWNGISIDAHPDYTDICKITRPNDTVINIICGKDDDNCKFRYNWRGSFSSIYIKELDDSRTKLVNPKWYGNLNNNNSNDFLGFKNSIEHAKSSSLDTILNTYNTDNKIINVLSIDVDGSEKELLENFDIKKYNPEFVCIELEEHSSSLKEDNKFIIDYMNSNNYILLTKFGEDYIWCNTYENSLKGKSIIDKINNIDNIISIPTIHPCNYFYQNSLTLSEENIKKYKEYIYSLF